MTHEKIPREGSVPTSRRRFLKAAGAAGVAATGLAGVGSAQPAETFEFDGGIGGWNALAPPSIEGEQNPPIELEAGQQYRVVWHNIDGFRHNFVIVDADGNEVVRTPVISEQGVTQTVEFTATEGMAEYFCEIHPRTMRGQVNIAGREEQPEGRRRAVEQVGTIGVERVAEGLTAPMAMEVAAEDRDRRFVVDQTGQIYVHEADGLRGEPFLDVSDRMVDIGIPELNGYDERGLLGLAFHPDFSNNRRLFVHYSAPVPEDYQTTLGEETTEQATETTAEDETTTVQGKSEPEPGLDHVSVIAEFEANEDLESVAPDSERRLMEIPSPQDNHNGGAMAFGPDDGYLYFGIGDGGAADDVGAGHVEDWYDRNAGGNGQDITQNLLGSIMRIDVDNQEGGNAYAVPDDNPLVGSEGLDEQYAWGFRNPWKLSFADDGRLFVADAGQNLWEEVSIVERGGNYGWNVKEGSHCFSTDDPSNPDAITDCPNESPRGESLRDPEIEYRHRESTTAFIDGSVVVGGYVYDGDAMADLQGSYVFGNWSGSGVVEADGEIFVASEPEDGDGQWSVGELAISGSDTGQLERYVMGFGEGQDGELYVLTSREFRPAGETGEVFRLVPEGEGEDVSVDDEQGEETTGGGGEETISEGGEETTTT